MDCGTSYRDVERRFDAPACLRQVFGYANNAVGLGHEIQYDEFLIEGIGSILAFDLIWNDQLERNSTTTMYDAVNDNGQLVTQVWHRGGYESDHPEGE